MFFLPIAMGVGMAGLSALGASQANSATSKAAVANQKAAAQEIVQNRMAIYDQMGQHSQAVQSRIGSFANSVGFRTGRSINSVIGQMFSDSQADSNALRNRLRNAEVSGQLQLQSIRANANTQMQSVGLAALQGGLQGFSMGMSLQSAISDMSTQLEVSKLVNDPSTPAWKIDALSRGVNPSFFNNAGFSNALQTNWTNMSNIANMSLQSARSSVGVLK